MIARDELDFDAPAALGHLGRLGLDVPTEVVDTPKISLSDHIGNGQREGSYDGMLHMALVTAQSNEHGAHSATFISPSKQR